MSENKIVTAPPVRRLVGVDNRPLAPVEQTPLHPEGTVPPQPTEKDKIILALRDLANRMESGELADPEFVMVIPKFASGDIPMFVFGPPMPVVMLEGIMHRLLTRMAMQGETHAQETACAG